MDNLCIPSTYSLESILLFIYTYIICILACHFFFGCFQYILLVLFSLSQKELFNHANSLGARKEVILLWDALLWRLKLPPYWSRQHLAVFVNLHGEAMALE